MKKIALSLVRILAVSLISSMAVALNYAVPWVAFTAVPAANHPTEAWQSTYSVPWTQSIPIVTNPQGVSVGGNGVSPVVSAFDSSGLSLSFSSIPSSEIENNELDYGIQMQSSFTARTTITFEAQAICNAGWICETLFCNTNGGTNSFALAADGSYTLTLNTPPGDTGIYLSCGGHAVINPAINPDPQTGVLTPLSGTAFMKITSVTVDVPTNTLGPDSVDSATSCLTPAHSLINMDTLSLGESIPLVGMPFQLAYSSKWYKTGSTFSTNAYGLGGWVPDFLQHYDLGSSSLSGGDGSFRIVASGRTATGELYTTNSDGSLIYIFDSAGKHLQTQSAISGVTLFTFGYDASGRLSTVTDQFGNTNQFAYYSGGATLTSPYGQVTTLAFDANGFLASVTNPNSETYLTSHSGGGQLLSFTKPGGQQSTNTYDANGNLTKDLGAGGDFISLVNSYNSTTRTQTVVASTAAGRQTTYTTSADDYQSSSHNVQLPTGAQGSASNEDVGYNSAADQYGNASDAMTSPDPLFQAMAPYVSSSEYTVPGTAIDISAETTKSVTGTSVSNPFAFSSLSSQTTLMEDSSRVASTVYTSANRTLVQTSPVGRILTQIFNTNGQVASTQMGSLLPTTMTYDTRGRLAQTTQGSRTTQLSYNSQGYLAQSIDPMGQTNLYSYDNAGRVTQQTLPDGSILQLAYDLNGNLTSVTPAGKTAHTFQFNLMELLSAYQPPALTGITNVSTTYTYNADGQLKQVTEPDGSTIGYTHSTSKGLLTQVTIPTGSYVYTYYSNSSLLNTLTSPDAETLTYTYVGNIPKTVVTSGTVNSALKFTFHADGETASIAVGPSTSALNSIALGYDKDDLLTSAGDESITRNDFGAVSASSIGSVAESLTFDSYGATASDNFTYNSATSLAAVTYTRDGLGRIAAVSGTVGNQNVGMSYTYDTQGRLSTVVQDVLPLRTYRYDANGNRLSVTPSSGTGSSASYDAQDRLLTYGGYTFQYDSIGNMSQMTYTTPSGGVSPLAAGKVSTNTLKIPTITTVTSYAFDILGNLKSVTLPSGNVISYIVDGQNRRVGKKVNGVLTQGFIYQNQTQIAAELDGSGNVIKQFIYASKQNIPDYMIYQSKEYRIISNPVGTPELIVDVAAGTILEQENYDEFGIPSASQTSSIIPFGFAGGIMDWDTRLVRMGARDYMPMVGRFVSKDPLLFGGGSANLYSYTMNDPINYIDPTGKKIYDNTGGNIPDEVINSPIFQKLNALSNPIYISLGTVPGSETDKGTTLYSKNGCYNEIVINPDMNVNQSDLVDSYFHELSHVNNNINFGASHGPEPDHVFFGPIDAGSGLFGSRGYQP